MKLPFTAFYDAFPQHQVTVQPRPDGSLLLTLQGRDGKPVCKAIDSEAFYSDERVRQVIHELQRDLKLEAGEVHWHDKGVDWVSRELPTYQGGPVHLTAAKTLVARRKQALEQQSRRTQAG
ncbi:DUF3509 domain-containing protein [Metapseudomonas lalkuanensis]|uniref:DUF3509 domain-containing protein n=1 Tax=Metapseudomonas lalkuanensis TaxID=2604832 RepID=A0A5J6QQ80_9GAMM|nr:DUF3509 domain-containing protein [Pseudomonas lalkuanensis]QEY62789.1 DUF3509 domain-containing protein [Pseudomonas lalkuanensis]UCO95985.1 DUF3509 domain-containing protein [Pseudomonas lalkuanensis]